MGKEVAKSEDKFESYKSQLLDSGRAPKFIDTLLAAALNDDHKNQAVAWKIVADRLLPVAGFEHAAGKGGGRSAIQININSTGAPSVDGEVIDG